MLRVLQQTPGYVQLEEVPKLSQPSQVTETHPPPRLSGMGSRSIKGKGLVGGLVGWGVAWGDGWGGLEVEDGSFGFSGRFYLFGSSNERMRGKGRFLFGTWNGMMNDIWNIGKCCDVIGIEHRSQIIPKLEFSTSPIFHISYMFLIVPMCFLYCTISCCCIVTAMSRSLESVEKSPQEFRDMQTKQTPSPLVSEKNATG